MTGRKEIGNIGEELATATLKSRGHYIVIRNYTCPFGEVDIITIKGNTLNFIEVKTRTSFLFGEPKEAIDRKKLERIKKSALYFLKSYFEPYEAIEFGAVNISVEVLENIEIGGRYDI